MLEHSAMYLNVTPPYEEDTSFFPDFYTTRLGPCDLQDPVWGKMSSLTAGVNKKRKKSETKPQAQINKCNNEKRRREQENIYIEELAELISANFADMSSLSVKPDKCAILQEAVNQIRSIKQQENATQSSDPVQQGEVSSSRPTILSNDFYGPLLLEALEGFLFVVNSEGKVEHVTENISNYIKFTRDDVLGKSIYNFIHHGDHTKFHSSLLPVTIEWGNEQQLNNKSKSIDIRLLVKPPDDLNQTIEEKQQRISNYELMHISSTQLRDHLSISEEDGSDSGPCLLCVASRISHRDKSTCNIEQFTTKLDTTGKVICVDTSGVTDTLAQYIKKELKNRPLRELVPQQEVNKVTAHLRETISLGQSSSSIYRLQFGPDKVIQVQTKSKLFKTNPPSNTDSDFIMATHSVIGENDLAGQGDTTSGSNNPLGGPLMPSVVNGNRNGPSISSGNENSSNTLVNTNTTFNPFNLDNEFNFEIFPNSTTWELESTNWQEGRPDSRASVTPTPRPPSNPSYSNATTVVQSSPFSSQPSPTVQNPPTPIASNPFTSAGNFFSSMNDQGYSMEEQKDTKPNALDDAAKTAESAKLRSLLTTPRNDSDDKNKDPILKELLNQQDEDSIRNNNKSSPRGLISRGSSLPGPSEQQKISNPSSENVMLRNLLNKPDDDDIESRVGRKKQSELLQMLMKPERETDDDKKNDIQCNGDLMRSLGFPSSPSNKTRKRSIEDKDENPSKKTSEGSQVSSSGSLTGNSLRERNKMLAFLLEKDSANHQPIPHIPASVISATPQEKLPRISDHNKSLQMVMSQNAMNARMGVNRMPGRPSQANSNYLNNLSNNNNMQHNDKRLNIVNSSCFTSPATSTTDTSIWEINMQASADPLLSELLDQVIDFVPEEIMHVLDLGDGQQNNNFQISEAVAINNIQKSLMQCESVVTSPGSPISLSGNPPAYSSTLTSQSNAVFSPPPNYPQPRFQRVQIRGSNVGNQQCPGNVNSQNLMQRTMFLQQQQDQKRRLLLQQKQQHLLISSNAAANEISSNINSIQNIDSLLNNTVAPNVSLQRSPSVSSESQMSPPYGQPSSRVANQQPYSPHSQLTSPAFPQTTSVTNYQNSPAGLSPQSQFNAQLSPRQAYPQANTQNASWQQAQSRMSLQQNPMLSAQLTRPPQQSQRSVNSPGSVGARHSPYPTNDQFPTPNSPNSAFNNPYLRLQRANSVPSATSQLPGGLGSPRSYSGRDHHSHLYPPVPPHPHSVPQMMSYQQDSQYCYDQTGIPLAYNGADRGRAPPHLQPGVSGSAPTSEFVRQELRAVVGARTAQAQPAAGATAPPSRPPSQMQLTQQQQVNDLETLGLNFEMASGASDSPKLWGAMGTDMGSMSPQPVNSRNTMEEARQGDPKSSLLQKLLSE